MSIRRCWWSKVLHAGRRAYHRGLNEEGEARGPGPRWFRRLLALGAALYLGGISLDAAGVPLHRIVPRPLLYFLQVARLFPHAVPLRTEYRAEAYACADRTWRELDVRPFFPLRANDKENRFDRAMFFYRHEPVVMQALDEYLVASNNRQGARIGGVLLLSLRLPIPPAGQVVERYRRKPLDEYGAEYRKYWYSTSAALRRERCHEDEGEDARGPAQP